MALSWIKRSKNPVSVDDLVARGKYEKALDLMRQEFAQRYPSPAERLRYADVLVLADRGSEAVPVLLGVADEQERYGFVDKAVEALRRAAEIDPEQSEVIDRIVALRTLPRNGAQNEASDDEAGEGDPRSASDSWGSALDGAFAASTAATETGEEEVDTGFDSSMLAPPGAGPAEVSSGEEGAESLLSDEDLEEIPEPFDDPAEQSAPELEEGLLEPADDDQEEIEPDALEPADDDSPSEAPFMSTEELEAEIEDDARALLAESDPKNAKLEPPTEANGEKGLADDARALLGRSIPRPDVARPLITEEELDEDRALDARALLTHHRAARGPSALLATDEDVENDLTGDARALLGQTAEEQSGPATSEDEDSRPLITEEELDTGPDIRADSAPVLPWEELQPLSDEDEEELHDFVLALGRREGSDRSALGAIFFEGLDREELRRVASGLHPRFFSTGEMVIQEGDPGNSLFLIASGSVRVLILGGHGQPFEIRRIDEGDFFGEVAALSGRPRSATVVAASPCEMLEIDREALEALVALRPAARALLDEACVGRALSPEESAVRSLPPEAADPSRAAEALRAHFGDCNWSPRVRLHLSRLMLDVGRRDDALAILAGVAEDLARSGQAQKAISVLKKVETIQRRGVQEVCLAPLRAGRRTSSARRASVRRGAPQAVKEAAFREWVGSLLRETAVLAERSASAIQEGAEGAGEEQAHQLAG